MNTRAFGMKTDNNGLSFRSGGLEEPVSNVPPPIRDRGTTSFRRRRNPGAWRGYPQKRTSRVNPSAHLHYVVPGKNRNPPTPSFRRRPESRGAGGPPSTPPSFPTPIGNLHVNPLSLQGPKDIEWRLRNRLFKPAFPTAASRCPIPFTRAAFTRPS